MNEKDNMMNEELVKAAEHGEEESIISLLRAGADVNARDANGKTVLMHGAQQGHHGCVDILLREGADVNAVWYRSETALVLAADKGWKECLERLLIAGAVVNSPFPQRLALVSAAWNGHIKCVELLLSAGADVNRTLEGCSALIGAAHGGRDNCVELLLNEGADVNLTRNDRSTALHEAAKGNHKERKGCRCVQLLLAARASVNPVDEFGETPLCKASRSGCMDCVHNLLTSGADVNGSETDGIPLICAASACNVEVIDFLRQHGADMNLQDSNGSTALIHAAYYGYNTCVKTIVEAGADVNVNNKEGFTALMAAAGSTRMPEANIFNTVRLLLQHAAHVNIYNTQGQNALQNHIYTEFWKSQQITLLLFAAGETINGTTVKGVVWTGLEWESKDKEIPHFLLRLIKPKLNLKEWCRFLIRKHLINLDPRLHLFHRTNQLGLPLSLLRYLLYNMSLDEPCVGENFVCE